MRKAIRFFSQQQILIEVKNGIENLDIPSTWDIERKLDDIINALKSD